MKKPQAIRTVGIEGCAGWELARRSSSPSCRASVRLGSGLRVCVGKEQWTAWVSGRGPAPLCGTWEGKHKLYSPPLNSPDPAPAKKPIFFFQASRLAPDAASGWVTRARFEGQRRTERLREQTDAWLEPLDSTGALTHLLTGTRRPDGSLELVLLLGFVHVLSASGIHLYALARWWELMLRRLAEASGVPVRVALPLARAASALSWTAGWLLGGARPGMLRPWLVVAMRLGARRLGARWVKCAPLVLALAADLCVAAARGELAAPHAHQGRWIYALACGGGLMARTPMGMAVGSWVLAALWQGWHEGLAALATPLISAATLPVYAVAVYPLGLLAVAFREAGLGGLAHELARAIGWLSESTVTWLSWAVMRASLLWSVGKPGLLLGMALAALLMRAGRGTRYALLAAVVAARLIAAELPRSARLDAAGASRGASRVEQLDVGQGDAALVRDPDGGAGLIDAGSERALKDGAWIQLLASRGVHRLDWVALTHLDEDHAGGLARLASLVPIGCVATSGEELRTGRGERLRALMAAHGTRVGTWESGCVPYPALGPPRSDGSARSKTNARMSAVMVPLDEGGFYLSAGDADTRDEPRVGAWAARQASAWGEGPRILKISHHGSRTSSDPRFLALVAPTEAWISSGAGNRYGHPSPEVIERVLGLGIRVRRTDRGGSLSAPRTAIRAAIARRRRPRRRR